MPRGRAKPLGGELQVGEYSTRGRKLFCEAFSRCHPEAIEELQHIAEQGTDEDIHKFCERYHLWCVADVVTEEQNTQDWLRQVVWDTVAIWRFSPSSRDKADWMVRVPAIGTSEVATDHDTDLEHRLTVMSQALVWNPTGETEAAFRERVERYMGEIRCLYETRDGLQVSPLTRNLVEHYDWTVCFYMDGESYEALAERVNKNVDTIRDAVRRVHREIGLPRPQPGERPRHS
jgi:hypothetical protein